jgi:aminoglycoside phosphotransferase (APT) family kinase protein
VLSKLRHFATAAPQAPDAIRSSISPQAALAAWEMDDAVVRRIDTGTLSAAFIARSTGQDWFLKTHLADSGRKTLAKEAALLAHLYADTLSAHSQAFGEGEGARVWLKMHALRELDAATTPTEILRLTASVHLSLKAASKAVTVAENDTLEHLAALAWSALDELARRELLSVETRRSVVRHLRLVQDRIGSHEPVLCHGDLGPKNLMTDGHQLFAIDWEDAFVGVQGYDYLFWLTFFTNRRHLTAEALGVTGLGRELEQALLVMILLLKSELSRRDGSHAGHALSFDQRIGEVLVLM